MSLCTRPHWLFLASRNLLWYTPWALLTLSAPAGAAQPAGKGAAARTDLYGDPLPERALARLGTTRLLHGDFVTATAFSADGRLFASASIDGSVVVWEWPSGKRLHAFTITVVLFPALRFAPDGRHLAVRADGRVLVWDLQSGREVLNEPGSAAPVFPAAGQRVAWIEDRHTVRMRDLATRKPQPGYPQGKEVREDVIALGCDAGGRLLTAEVEAGALAVHDPAAGKRLCRIELPDGLLWAQFSADARRVVVQTRTAGVLVLGVPQGKVLRRMAALGKEARPLTPTPDGKALLVTIPKRPALELWDLEAGKRVCTIPSGFVTGNSQAASFSPDGKLLALGGINRDHAATFWNTATGEYVERFAGSRSQIHAVAFSPDGKEVATCGAVRGDPLVRLWDPASGRLRRSFAAHAGGTSQVAYTPDGTGLVTCGLWDKEDVCLWDARTLTKRLAVKGHLHGAGRLAVSPGGEWVASLGLGARSPDVAVWDLKTGKKLYVQSDAGLSAADLAFVPGGRTLVVGGHFWQLAGVDGVWPKEPKAWATGRVVFSADGRVAAATASYEQTRVVEVASGLELRRFGERGLWGEAAFASDSRTLAVTGPRARLFDWWTGEERLALPAAGTDALLLAFAPDGRRLATVGNGVEGASVLIWDVADATRRPPPAGAATKDQIETWCAALVSLDAATAYRSAASLAAVPEQAVRRLRALAVEVAPPKPADVARWLAELDHTRFVVREKAMKGLMSADGAAAQVEAALQEGPSLEKKRRLDQVLAVLRSRPASAARLFAIRGVMVLEWLGTAEARALLREFAAGDGRAQLTQEARLALRRLTGKAVSP